VTRSIEDESHEQFERRLLTNYNLDEGKLSRLGFFFLVHSHIDIKLIALVVKAETEKAKRQRDSPSTTTGVYLSSGRTARSPSI